MLPSKPSILLAEDDPIAHEVILAHLLALGCDVQSTAAVAETIALCGTHRFDALLLDCQLRGGDALTVLRALREDPDCRNVHTQAIAMSAELDDRRLESLILGGFADAMEKPIPRERLRLALSVCAVTGMRNADTTSTSDVVSVSSQVLDDRAGLLACGNTEVLSGLRMLLAKELPGYRAQIDEASGRGDLMQLRDCVHKMKSALGFCGASELKSQLDRAGQEMPEAGLLSDWRKAMDRLAGALLALQQK